MEIVITLDETLTVGARIDGVTNPTQTQACALRDLAQVAGILRPNLLGGDQS